MPTSDERLRSVTSPALILLVGLPGSGKSALAASLCASGFCVCNMDSIVQMVSGGRYDVGLKSVYRAMETALIRTALSVGRSVVVDRTNTTVSQRARFIALGRESANGANTHITAIVMASSAPAEHVARRVQADARGYSPARWLEVISTMAENYEQPTYAEGFDYILPATDAEVRGWLAATNRRRV